MTKDLMKLTISGDGGLTPELLDALSKKVDDMGGYTALNGAELLFLRSINAIVSAMVGDNKVISNRYELAEIYIREHQQHWDGKLKLILEKGEADTDLHVELNDLFITHFMTKKMKELFNILDLKSLTLDLEENIKTMLLELLITNIKMTQEMESNLVVIFEAIADRITATGNSKPNISTLRGLSIIWIIEDM